MSYNEFLALTAQILPYSMESEAIRIPQMVCRDRVFITYLKNNGIKQLEFSQCLTKLLPGIFILFFNLSRAFIERQQILTFPSATEDEGKVRKIPGFFSTGKCLLWGHKALEPNPGEDSVN